MERIGRRTSTRPRRGNDGLGQRPGCGMVKRTEANSSLAAAEGSMRMDARLGQQSRPTGPQDRDLPCSECGLLLPPADHPTHLIAVHGYVGVEGQLLARPAALAFLWERVFTSADSKAHDHLCVLLVPAEARGQ